MDIDLPSLAALVVGGVSIMVFVTHLTGGSVTARLASDEEARERWSFDDPVPVTRVQRADDDTGALLELQDGSIGVVFALGDRFVCRRLGPTTLRRAHTKGSDLVVVLADFAAPSIRLPFADAEVRQDWQRRLET